MRQPELHDKNAQKKRKRIVTKLVRYVYNNKNNNSNRKRLNKTKCVVGSVGVGVV